MENKKLELITESVSLGIGPDVDVLQKVKNELTSFMYENVSDKDIEEALLIINARIITVGDERYVEATKMSTPILRRLGTLQVEEFRGMDKTFLSIVVFWAETPEQLITLVEKGLKLEYKLEGTKPTLLLNATCRLLRAKYREKTDLVKLTEYFNKCVILGLELCKQSEDRKYNLLYHQMFVVYQYLFEKDEKAARASLQTLRKEKEVRLVKILTEVINEIMDYAAKSVERNLLDDIIGKNLKKHRKDTGFKGKDIAKHLDISPVEVTHYEQGRRPIPLIYLVKLSKLYGVTIDEIFYGKEEGTEDEDSKTDMTKSINMLLSNTSENYLDFILETIKKTKPILKSEEE
ncbi:MAG: helix-turn-helix domain-containing protein [Defluviitaleaceae bacterium]|nr:helix-turn-helix domain-containing protein [Defluviitaleaceae bacterium]